MNISSSRKLFAFVYLHVLSHNERVLHEITVNWLCPITVFARAWLMQWINASLPALRHGFDSRSLLILTLSETNPIKYMSSNYVQSS